MANFLLVFLAAATASVPAYAGPELSDRVAITAVDGPQDVEVIRGVGHRKEYVQRGENLFVGDEIHVAPKQLVRLTTHDDAEYRLAPGTELKLTARDPDKQTLSFWTFSMLKGALLGTVDKQNGKDGYRLKIHTQTAALGIRGTKFLLSSSEQSSSVDVLEGKVWWGTDLKFPPGSFRELTPAHHGEVGADKRISVVDSKGDEPKLLRDYGLVLDSAPSKLIHGTLQECSSLGYGWRSGDGVNGGECFPQRE